MWIFKIIFLFIIAIIVWHFSTIKWKDIYTLTFCFGRKGQGKSSILAMDAYEGFKDNWTVFTQEHLTFQIRDKKTRKIVTYSTLPLDPVHIYDYPYPPRSLILVDEASLIWSNRDFANKSKAEQLRRTVEWFQQQRKKQCRVILYSVSFDVDKKIRDQCDRMILVRKYFRILSVGRIMHREPVVVHPVGESPASVQEDIIEEPPIRWIFGGLRLCFIPKWTRYFDSFRMVVDSSGSAESPPSPYPAVALRAEYPVDVPDVSSASSSQLVEPRILFENKARRGLFSRKRNRMKTT